MLQNYFIYVPRDVYDIATIFRIVHKNFHAVIIGLMLVVRMVADMSFEAPGPKIF